MSTHLYLAFGAGMFFMSLLVAVGCFIAFRPDARPIPAQAMWIFRVVLALAGAAFAVVISGFLDISARFSGWSLRTGGALAVFITLYLLDPPDHLSRRLRKPHKAVRVSIPPERLRKSLDK